MATPSSEGEGRKLTFLRYQEGDSAPGPWQEHIFNASWSYKCPTYVQRTPPCQGSCPAGEDIRGWLDIVRGLDKPAAGGSWQEYAFRRLSNANPFPSIMGRVCPAPCEAGCNRNAVEDHVGINAVEQYIGDAALDLKLRFDPAPADTGKRVAIVGGGVAGLSCAYQLRRRGHACTIFEAQPELGGMLRYGLPAYRVPADVTRGEVQRILDLGVEVRTNTRVGKDVSLEQLDNEYDAVFWALGTQQGRKLPIPGADAPNCVGGIEYLRAFNEGRLAEAPSHIVIIGGGDTSIDVATVARKLRGAPTGAAKPATYTADAVLSAAAQGGQQVTLTTIFPLDQIQASAREVADAQSLNVDIRGGVMPVEILLDKQGRARAVRFAACKVVKNVPQRIEGGAEFDIDADLVVFAVGQKSDLAGLEALDNGRSAIDADGSFQVKGRPGHFAGGDVVAPHLLTTAIGHGVVAAEGIDSWLKGREPVKRPKVDKRHFDLLAELRGRGMQPADYAPEPVWGTADAEFAVHNFENRAANDIIPSQELFLGHYTYVARNERDERRLAELFAEGGERIARLSEQQAVAEAKRCMSCGMCIECDNCVIYCPQHAVAKTPRDQRAVGRYVFTDYTRCIGCHVCSDVCPTGYIQMGLGS